MELDLIWIGLGIAAAGYCIGNGLQNFKNPYAQGIFDDDDEHELIQGKDVHHFIGVPKGDVQHLIKEYPNIPQIFINGKVFYPKVKLRKWLENLGE